MILIKLINFLQEIEAARAINLFESTVELLHYFIVAFIKC